MSFLKTAKAVVTKTSVTVDEWNSVIVGFNTGRDPNSRIRTAGSVVTAEYSPEKYLLTHCTIVASVDVVPGPEASKLGRHMATYPDYGTFQVERRYPDYYVKSGCDPWINNNSDCFERELVRVAHKTFVGADNFVEHIQIPELSKGKVIDVALRDTGESLYVDILVATERRHTDLVRDIETEKLFTLSMGCIVAFTICTKCGNVAVDETDLCPCIKYEKGNYFLDKFGERRRVAEICGHKDTPESVIWMDASWVRDPAFIGAVMRNILQISSKSQPVAASKIQLAFEMGARRLSPDQMVRMAKVDPRFAFTLSADDEMPAGEALPPEPAQQQAPPEEQAPPDKSETLVKDLSDEILSRAKDEAKNQLFKQSKPSLLKDLTEDNDSLITSSEVDSSNRKAFIKRYAGTGLKDGELITVHSILQVLRQGGWKRVGKSAQFSGRQILAAARFLDMYGKEPQHPLPVDCYMAVAAVGGTAPFDCESNYLLACVQQLGRKIQKDEAAGLIVKGKLFSLGARATA